MQKIGLWQIDGEQPKKIVESKVNLEQHLEAWIERDPSLLRAGLTIIGKQIEVEGGRLDLLALDEVGRVNVIEIKRGEVRRETIAQVIDYASCIAKMPGDELRDKISAYLQTRGQSLTELLEERDARELIETDAREVLLFVVGTGRAPGLERMVSFLGEFNLPVSVVSYEVFELSDGQRILVRELTEADSTGKISAAAKTQAAYDCEVLCGLADLNGIGQEFRTLLRVAEKHGIYPRARKGGIMYTPAANRSRTLIWIEVKPKRDGTVPFWMSAAGFADFYPVTVEEITAKFGVVEGQISREEMAGFIARLDNFLTELAGGNT